MTQRNITIALASLAIVLVVLIIVLLTRPRTPAPRVAQMFYVQKNSSSDSNPCTAAQPCLTITRGLQVLGSGDTLIIGDGTYAEYVHWLAPVSGTAANPTIIKAQNRNQAKIIPNNTSEFYAILLGDTSDTITY